MKFLKKKPPEEKPALPPMPGMIWEWRRNFVLATSALLVVVFATLFLPKAWQLNLPYVFVACIAIILIVYRLQLRTNLKKLHQAQFRVCPECGYCLDHLPDEHKCPECGTPYHLKDLADRWQKWHEAQPPTPGPDSPLPDTNLDTKK